MLNTYVEQMSDQLFPNRGARFKKNPGSRSLFDSYLENPQSVITSDSESVEFAVNNQLTIFDQKAVNKKRTSTKRMSSKKSQDSEARARFAADAEYVLHRFQEEMFPEKLSSQRFTDSLNLCGSSDLDPNIVNVFSSTFDPEDYSDLLPKDRKEARQAVAEFQRNFELHQVEAQSLCAMCPARLECLAQSFTFATTHNTDVILSFREQRLIDEYGVESVDELDLTDDDVAELNREDQGGISDEEMTTFLDNNPNYYKNISYLRVEHYGIYGGWKHEDRINMADYLFDATDASDIGDYNPETVFPNGEVGFNIPPSNDQISQYRGIINRNIAYLYEHGVKQDHANVIPLRAVA